MSLCMDFNWIQDANSKLASDPIKNCCSQVIKLELETRKVDDSHVKILSKFELINVRSIDLANNSIRRKGAGYLAKSIMWTICIHSF